MALFQAYYIYNILIFVYWISNNYPKNKNIAWILLDLVFRQQKKQKSFLLINKYEY